MLAITTSSCDFCPPNSTSKTALPYSCMLVLSALLSDAAGYSFAIVSSGFFLYTLSDIRIFNALLSVVNMTSTY